MMLKCEFCGPGELTGFGAAAAKSGTWISWFPQLMHTHYG